MTRSTVASVRWVTATEDANSIVASLTSAGEKPCRTHFPADDFSRAQHVPPAAPSKSILLYCTNAYPSERVGKNCDCEVYNRPMPVSMSVSKREATGTAEPKTDVGIFPPSILYSPRKRAPHPSQGWA